MDRVLARDFIDEQLPVPLQDMLPAAFRTAYASVEQFVKSANFLQTQSAIFGRGHLVAWAADYEIFRLIREGHWPFDAEWQPFAKPTGMYLRIDTGAAFVTVSQLQELGEGPRRAVFRANASLTNHALLPFSEFAREAEDQDRKHLIIGHGYQTLDFIVVGAPNPKKPKVWIDRTDNLLLRKKPDAADFSPDGPPGNVPPADEEGADIEIDLDLVEHLKKQARDNNV